MSGYRPRRKLKGQKLVISEILSIFILACVFIAEIVFIQCIPKLYGYTCDYNLVLQDCLKQQNASLTEYSKLLHNYSRLNINLASLIDISMEFSQSHESKYQKAHVLAKCFKREASIQNEKTLSFAPLYLLYTVILTISFFFANVILYSSCIFITLTLLVNGFKGFHSTIAVKSIRNYCKKNQKFVGIEGFIILLSFLNVMLVLSGLVLVILLFAQVGVNYCRDEGFQWYLRTI